MKHLNECHAAEHKKIIANKSETFFRDIADSLIRKGGESGQNKDTKGKKVSRVKAGFTFIRMLHSTQGIQNCRFS